MSTKVKLDNLDPDGSFHERVEINPDALRRYTELYIQREGKGPAIKVQRGTGKIIDGRHRYYAAQKANVKEIEVTYVDIADKDLRAKAYEFNKAHGIPYSTAERNQVIVKLSMLDGWTQSEIAKLTGLDRSYISKLLRRYISSVPSHSTYNQQAFESDDLPWNIVKELVRARDEYHCAICQSIPDKHPGLHCHHIDSDDSNNNFGNLISLCIGCHTKVHNGIEETLKLIQEYMIRVPKITLEFYQEWVNQADKRRVIPAGTETAVLRRRLAGETQTSIAESYGVTQPRISNIISEYRERICGLYTTGKMKTEIAREMSLEIELIDKVLLTFVRGKYEPINFKPVYTSWWPAFGIDKRYGRKWKGNIPAGLAQNILYFYTRPSDHILDPFAGGGVVIDVCNDMIGRTCEAFDIDPHKERDDIKYHNILNGSPPCEKKPTFIFLDPPYGPIAEGKYTEREDDLSNKSVSEFLDAMEKIFGYWDNAKLALLMCGMRKDKKYTDLPMLVGQRLHSAGWTILERIVNSIGQTESDNALWEKKEREERLVLHRHIDIWIAER